MPAARSFAQSKVSAPERHSGPGLDRQHSQHGHAPTRDARTRNTPPPDVPPAVEQHRGEPPPPSLHTDFASVPLSAGAPPSPSTVQRPAHAVHAAPSPASVARRPDARVISDARGLLVSAGEQLATLGPGEPLEPATRVRMERAFGYGLSPVRVHRGEPGAALATVAGARALAVGEHVAFAAGEYRPGTPAGDALLAHELAHSDAQEPRGEAPLHVPGDPGDEAEADDRAAGALLDLWGGVKRKRARRRTARAGLRLARCETTYTKDQLQQYLTTIDRDDRISSDDGAAKARQVIVWWCTSGKDFVLTPQRKALLIKQLIADGDSNANQEAILNLLWHVEAEEWDPLLARVSMPRILSIFDGSRRKRLMNFVRVRFDGGLAGARSPVAYDAINGQPLEFGQEAPRQEVDELSGVPTEQGPRRKGELSPSQVDALVQNKFGKYLTQELGGKFDVGATTKVLNTPRETFEANYEGYAKEKAPPGLAAFWMPNDVIDDRRGGTVYESGEPDGSTMIHEIMHAYSSPKFRHEAGIVPLPDGDAGHGKFTSGHLFREGMTDWFARQIAIDTNLRIPSSYSGPRIAIGQLSILVTDEPLRWAFFAGKLDDLAQAVDQRAGKGAWTEFLLACDAQLWDQASERLRRQAPTAGKPEQAPVARKAAEEKVPLAPVTVPGDAVEREAERGADAAVARLGGHAVAPPELALRAQAVARAEKAPVEMRAAGLIVDDEAETLTAGQMRKSALLAALRIEACAAADRALAEVGRNTRGCPYVERWLGYYASKPAQHLERAILKYAPEARSASAAADYIRPVSEHIGRGARAWAQTGRLPADVPDELRQAAVGGGALSAVAAIGGAIAGALSGIGRALGGLFAKPRDGGARLAVDRAALHDRLGPGRPIDGAVRTRMESAFVADFAHVRVHDDGRAAALSGDLRARAFTLGDHVAFGPGEYRPGTPAGDALIAHELAHVVQQSGTVAPSQPAVDATPAPALEAEADEAAAAAVIDLHGGRRRPDRWRRKLGRRRGLRLQRCGTDLREGTRLPTSAQQTNIRSDLNFPIASTHAAGAAAPPTPAGVSASAAAASTEWAGAIHPGDTPQQIAQATARRAEIKARLLAGVTAEFNRQLQTAHARQSSASGTSLSEFEGAANAAKRVVDDRYSDWRDPRVGVGAPQPGEFHAGVNLRSSFDRPQNDPRVFAPPETRVYNLATYSGPNNAPSVASTLRGAPYFYNINRNESGPTNSESGFFHTEITVPFVTAHQADLNLITQYNYAVTDIGGGRVYISPSSPSAGAKWSAFATTVHEYLHVLEHPIFQRTANKTMSEGFTEYFAAQTLTSLPLETAPMNDSLRSQVEAPTPGPPGRLPPYQTPSTYREYVQAARQAKSELGSDPGAENAMRGAFFQGHVELVGFDPQHPGTPGPVRSPNLAPGMREHIVIAVGGVVETGEMIARIHDVKLADLQRANPGVNLSTLHAGNRVLVPRS